MTEKTEKFELTINKISRLHQERNKTWICWSDSDI